MVAGALFGLRVIRSEEKQVVNPFYLEAMRELDELDGGIDRKGIR